MTTKKRPESLAVAEPVLIELDDRRRAYLGKVGHDEHSRYLARTDPDGTIVLEPAVVLTEHDLRLASRPDILDVLERARTQPERLVRGRKRPASRQGGSTG